MAATLAQILKAKGNPKIALQLLLYPMLDDLRTTDERTRHIGKLIWTDRYHKFAWSQYRGTAANPSDTREDAARLRAHGSNCELFEAGGAYHSFDHHAKLAPETIELHSQMQRVLAKLL